MLVTVFWVLIVAGASAAAVFWALAIRTAYWILTGVRASDGRNATAGWIMMVVWPFAMRHTAGAPADQATSLNKMLVGFFAAILVATGSLAVYSNLTFVPPKAAQTLQ